MKSFEQYSFMSFLSYCKKMLNVHEDYKAYRIEYIDNGVIWKTRYMVGGKISNRIKEFVKAGAAKLTDITESVRNDNKITKDTLCPRCKKYDLTDNILCPKCGVINDNKIT